LNANFFCIELSPVCFEEEAIADLALENFIPTHKLNNFLFLDPQATRNSRLLKRSDAESGRQAGSPFSKLVLEIAINTKVVSKLISRRRCSATW
jgi:hypothetical protein